MIPLDQDTSPQSEPKAMKDKDLSHLVGTDPDEFKTGTVSAVADYGLFVNVEGVDGLLHISKMRYVLPLRTIRLLTLSVSGGVTIFGVGTGLSHRMINVFA